MTKAKAKRKRSMDAWLRKMALAKVREAADALGIAESDVEIARDELEDAQRQYRNIVRATSGNARKG